MSFKLYVDTVANNEFNSEKRLMLLDVTESLNLLSQKEIENQTLRQYNCIFAHDLKSPVSNIVQLLDLLEECENREEKALLLSHARVALKRIFKVQTEIERLVLNNNTESSFDIKEVIEEVKAIESFGIDDLTINCRPNMLFSSRSKLFLYSIFSNLVSNSIKYSQTSKLIIDIEIEKTEDGCWIFFSDNGKGLDTSIEISDLFNLGARSKLSIVQGNGLGLYMVKSQIDLLGGKITTQNHKNKGLSFKIFLPKM